MAKNAKKSEKKDRRIYYFVGIFVVAILAVLGLSFFSQGNTNVKYSYNGYSFVKEQGFWNVLVKVSTSNGPTIYNLETRFGPKEIDYIPTDRLVMDFFKDGEKNIDSLYLTVDAKNNNNSVMALAAYDLAANLARVLGINVVAACTSNTSDACADRPIITCADKFPVIYLKEADKEEIKYEPHRCVIVEGKDAGIVKSVDRLLFQWYGVMQ